MYIVHWSVYFLSSFRDYSHNGFIITWILHQIIIYSNKVKLVAGLSIHPHYPIPPSNQLDKRTDQVMSIIAT